MQVEDLRSREFKESQRLRKILNRGFLLEEEYLPKVKEIVERVREEGDRALKEYSKVFDGEEFYQVSPEELRRAYEETEEEVKRALKFAKGRIEEFHKRQRLESFFLVEEGIVLAQRVLPLKRVGIYVPGGKASYPSTVLMSVIPAKLAGVEEVVVLCPRPTKEVLCACFIAKVDKVFKLGGAHGISALAFGTQSVPKVDKVVGPGNVFVALAKKVLYGIVDIDMVAGPSEILVVADESANPKLIAIDLLSQAEHDELAGVFLITDSEEIAFKVKEEVERLVPTLERKDIIRESLKNFGTIFLVEDLNRALELANLIAPEHLQLHLKEPLTYVEKVKNAGAVFLGSWTTESLGDYVLGPNHTLPTSGSARFFSPLSVYDFLKRINLMAIDKKGFERVKEFAKTLARVEGLTAHERAITLREEI